MSGYIAPVSTDASSVRVFLARIIADPTAFTKALAACETQDIYTVDDLQLIANQNNLDKIFTQGTVAHILHELMPVAMPVALEVVPDGTNTKADLIPIAVDVTPLPSSDETKESSVGETKVSLEDYSSSVGETKTDTGPSVSFKLNNATVAIKRSHTFLHKGRTLLNVSLCLKAGAKPLQLHIKQTPSTSAERCQLTCTDPTSNVQVGLHSSWGKPGPNVEGGSVILHAHKPGDWEPARDHWRINVDGTMSPCANTLIVIGFDSSNNKVVLVKKGSQNALQVVLTPEISSTSTFQVSPSGTYIDGAGHTIKTVPVMKKGGPKEGK